MPSVPGPTGGVSQIANRIARQVIRRPPLQRYKKLDGKILNTCHIKNWPELWVMRRMLLRPAAWFHQHSEYLTLGLLDHVAVPLHEPSVEARASLRPWGKPPEFNPDANPLTAPTTCCAPRGLNLPARHPLLRRSSARTWRARPSQLGCRVGLAGSNREVPRLPSYRARNGPALTSGSI